MSTDVPEPWNAFLRDLDRIAAGLTDLHCIGGFVITAVYGYGRETVDIDVLTVASVPASREIFDGAGKGSELHKKHGIYLDHVTVIEAYPDDYESRLKVIYSGAFSNIRLWAPEPHDLALMKLGRNSEKDRDDVKYLARAGLITSDQLRSRYQTEMRPYIALPEQRADPILESWIEMLHEQANG
jgi:hypothetical protein